MSAVPATTLLRVADTGRLHLSADGQRSLCARLRPIDPRDLHDPDAGLRVWDERASARCAICEARLDEAQR